MKTSAFLLVAALVALSTPGAVRGQDEKSALGEQQKISYMLGMDVARSMQRLGSDIDRDVFLRAFNDVLDGRKPVLSDADYARVKQTFQKDLMRLRQEKARLTAAKNLSEGKAFLAKNGQREGVLQTASGLQYEVIRGAEGPKPKPTDKVTVNYRGTLINGQEFDSSYARHQPATFALNGVIKGWTEGLQLMTVGSKFKFYIPPELAYGERGTSRRIGPNAALIFEVELLNINPEPKPAAAASAKQ